MPDELDTTFEGPQVEPEVRTLMDDGTGRKRPFPTDYDPCPTCSYRVKNETLETHIRELEVLLGRSDRVATAVVAFREVLNLPGGIGNEAVDALTELINAVTAWQAPPDADDSGEGFKHVSNSWVSDECL